MSLTATRITVIATSIVVAGLANSLGGLVVNLTNSEPTGIYLRVPGKPKRGGLVALRPLMKHVVAVPGDVVTVTAQGTHVNGRFWPSSAIAEDTHGYQPFPFGTYALRPGQYWLLGTSPDSWDSRYIGPVPIDLIDSSVEPVWATRNAYTPATRP
jgi:type IV secretory pathway protease TraF